MQCAHASLGFSELATTLVAMPFQEGGWLFVVLIGGRGNRHRLAVRGPIAG